MREHQFDFGTKRSQVQILSPRPVSAQCVSVTRMIFVHGVQKFPIFHRAISELGENWGSLGEKKASRMGAERWRRAGNGAPLFFFIPQFFPSWARSSKPCAACAASSSRRRSAWAHMRSVTLASPWPMRVATATASMLFVNSMVACV